MNTYHIKYFIDAAKNQSITRSAQLNFVTHAAVSLGVRSLERELGTDLLKHSKRRFELTPEGEHFYQYANRLLSDLDQLKESVSSLTKEPTGNLEIWAPQSLFVDKISSKLIEYKKLYPKVNLVINTGAARVVRENIRSNQTQLGFLLDDNFTDDFISKEIDHGEFALVGDKKQSLNEKLQIMITAQDKVEVQYFKKHFKRKFKKDFTIALEVVSWTLIKSLAQKGLAVGYLPDYLVREELKNGTLHKIKTPWPDYKYTVKAIWNKNKSLHRNSQLFMDLLTKR